MSEIKKLNRKTRKLLTMERMNHPKANVERIYLPRQIGGRGLTQLELTYKTTTVGLNVYLEQTEDPLLKLVHRVEKNKKLYSVVKDVSKIKNELGESDLARKYHESITKFAKRVKQETKKRYRRRCNMFWKKNRCMVNTQRE